jgi:hypothetical protein
VPATDATDSAIEQAALTCTAGLTPLSAECSYQQRVEPVAPPTCELIFEAAVTPAAENCPAGCVFEHDTRDFKIAAGCSYQDNAPSKPPENGIPPGCINPPFGAAGACNIGAPYLTKLESNKWSVAITLVVVPAALYLPGSTVGLLPGGALSRAPVTMPGQPMIALVYLVDIYGNALVDSNEATMFKVACERCRWPSRCSEASALTQSACVSMGSCATTEAIRGDECLFDNEADCTASSICQVNEDYDPDDGSALCMLHRQSWCESLGSCSREEFVEEETCVAEGACVEDDTGVVPADTLAAAVDSATCELLGSCHSTPECVDEALGNIYVRCAGSPDGDVLSTETDCATPPGLCTALNAEDGAACAAVQPADRHDDTLCLQVMRSNGQDLACEWLGVQPGAWTPASWAPEVWTPTVWTPEVWTEGRAVVRYGEYEVFAAGSLVNLGKNSSV